MYVTWRVGGEVFIYLWDCGYVDGFVGLWVWTRCVDKVGNLREGLELK